MSKKKINKKYLCIVRPANKNTTKIKRRTYELMKNTISRDTYHDIRVRTWGLCAMQIRGM